MRLPPAAAAAALCAVLLASLPLPAPAEEPPAPDGKALDALAAEWMRAPDDDARAAVEARARALPPLPASSVEAAAERLFALAEKSGRRLARKGRATLYTPAEAAAMQGKDPRDPKALKALKDEDLGLYLLNMGKPKGGLLIAMHGGGENAGDAGSAQSIWAGATAQGMTVIAPQAIDLVSSAWNQEKQERFVLDLIDAARRTLDVDPDRVCLAGHSMGGDGSWMLGGRNADRLAAAAPLAGSVMPYMKQGAVNRLQTPLSSYEGLQEGVIANLMHLPLWIHHSADDPNEAIHPDDIATGRLRTLQERFPGRYEFRYDRVDGNGHALPKGGVKPILQWMAGRTRRAHPDEVVWETWNPWKERMYWLFSRGHRDSWRFHAKIVAPNAVEVTGTTKPLAGRTAPAEMALTLLLGPELFDLSKPLKVTSGGKVLFEGRVEPSFFALMASILPRNDPKQWYRAHVDLKVPRLPWKELWD
ncbi:MAG: hypothetical protein L6R43_02460 [Planctomycetes bacterium]|nr:hypothetical protein [Planctomycetota bacterium]